MRLDPLSILRRQSEEKKELLSKYFPKLLDKFPPAHIKPEIPETDFKLLIELYLDGYLYFECVRCKNSKKLNFKESGALAILTSAGKYELSDYLEEKEIFKKIEEDAKLMQLRWENPPQNP